MSYVIRNVEQALSEVAALVENRNVDVLPDDIALALEAEAAKIEKICNAAKRGFFVRFQQKNVKLPVNL